MSYVFANPDSTIVVVDGISFVPWDPVNGVPLSGGAALRAWQAAGAPAPTPYVAPPPTPQQQFDSATASGVTLSWSSSTGLNGTYAVDPTTQNNITAEGVSILMNNAFTNGQQTRYWPELNGTPHQFTVAQFKIFSTAIAAYVDSLNAAMAGQAPWPSNALSVSG